MKLFIRPDGTVVTVGDMPAYLTGSGKVFQYRQSTVVPVNPVKRAAFRLARWIFGEKGRVANWTRQWKGPWQATILATGEKFTSHSRRCCIDWEVIKLVERIRKGTNNEHQN